MSKVASCVAIAVALLWAASARAEHMIAPTAMAERMQQQPAPLVLDVRTEEEFAEGALPGARLIPHDQLASRLAELGQPGEVFVYCRSGRRVKLAAEVLNAAGFRVHEIEGSFLAWQAAELPIEVPVGSADKEVKK
ncbi:rhodanese-like domain-containing protein [Pseudomarimonas arenosa]|uniref:Rhodanese-like domain-containing protein n=1 Tax=Pseudomarimonas arenosa TaxID=2774145 RepID=A0AAW3ZRC9_9GAMM|nr:rhodanese-like domain-containing protein [Pseudomarimonas arenosa]MBD8528095.1 rhodanese-like domain-containing protein [Pseudomarimonas arenosa]